MRERNFLFIFIFFILLTVGTFVHGIYRDQVDWRNDVQRYHCFYHVRVTGLSGREVEGTTVIMVPIPASKEGKFFTPSPQKDIYFSQKLTHIVFDWNDKSGKTPYFENMTEKFDNKVLCNHWTSFIVESDKGYMLEFRTNDTRLEDIHCGVSLIGDYFDIFDPINNGSPMLFLVENLSNISSVPYGDYTKYTSYPTYDTYVYLSNNLNGGENVSFKIMLTTNNDPTEWPQKYVGKYSTILFANVNDTGYVKVSAILGQEVPIRNKSLSVLGSQYARDFYDNKASHVVK
ncbi:hypothetical protein [Methanosarcina acetivorans]|uniref:Uncharacterized protein n=1 Tax=Methanosarcina acetivorans (strain ATCC 35395 / DSM 2834 / JCM 12185 / C2A) TaxID=188937 RepID=Q8TTC7_METAC|nr:hypothetical protein [Methanosarcina acetivorans]AAM03954.1 predicted protein [Methanosarcina acetivorans C2A]